MADNFKWSLKETLGLQVESLQLDLELEREKSKRLEAEINDLKIKRQDDSTSGILIL
jgi:hypothetical protein